MSTSSGRVRRKSTCWETRPKWFRALESSDPTCAGCWPRSPNDVTAFSGNGSVFMPQKSDEQFEAAEACGRHLLRTEPRAVAARYDKTTRRVTLDLVNGCSYAFPAERVQDLYGAADHGLADIEVDGAGFNLHWPALDVDLYVPTLIAASSARGNGSHANSPGWPGSRVRRPKPRRPDRTAPKAAAPAKSRRVNSAPPA